MDRRGATCGPRRARSHGASDAVGPDGAPSVRIVLCRGVDAQGLQFFTNYESRKGRELAVNSRAAVAFHWASLERQVRVEGTTDKLSPDESDAYFGARARGSQLAASVSPQSTPIADLEALRQRQRELDAELAGRAVPRPAHWGGYRLRAYAVEIWTGALTVLHHRVRHELKDGRWVACLLAP